MLERFLIVFAVTFLVRIYSVMAGGGRLALIPMLTVLIGLEPSAAIATMKCGGLSSSFSIIKFHKHGLVKWKLWMKIAPWVFLGTLCGPYLVIVIDQEIFQKLISISICISLLLLLFRKSKAKRTGHVSDERVSLLARFLAGLVGLFGALFGIKGAFLRYWYVSRGLSFLEATATNKATSAVAKIISVATFSAVGLVDWPVAITMFVAGGLGSWAGASLGIKLGSKWVERIFVAVVIVGVIAMFVKS